MASLVDHSVGREAPEQNDNLAARLAASAIIATIIRLVQTRKGAVGLTVLVALVLTAIFAPRLAPYDPNENHLLFQLAPPSATYWFGTDELGRDILSRVIFGSSPSLLTGLLAVALAAAVGFLTGVVGGFVRGWLDLIVMRLWDTLLAFPAIFLAIGI